jgi:hypothetical protein
MADFTERNYETGIFSGQRNSTLVIDDLKSFNARSLSVVVDLTAFTTAASLTVSIDMKDPVSGKYIAVLTGALINANGTQRLRISPHLAAVANQVANDLCPATFRITVTHGNGNNHTYTVSVIRHG